MALDPSIALQAKPVVLPDPVTQYGNVLQLQGAQQQNALRDIQTQAATRDFANQNALQSAASDPTIQALPFDQQAQAYLARGGSAAIPLIKSMGENRKMNVETNNAIQTNAAAQAKDIAETIGAAKTPADLLQMGVMGIAQKRWDADKFQPVIQHLLSGQYNDPQKFADYKQQLLDGIRSPDQLATANTPTPTKVETQGGTAFVDTNARTNPGITSAPVIPGNPNLTTGPQGDPLTRSADGRTISQPTFTGGASGGNPMPAPQAAAGKFAGDPDKIAASIAKLPDSPDKAALNQAFANWRAAGAPQGQPVQPTFQQWSQANPSNTAATDPTVKNYTAPLLAANLGEYAKGLQTRSETYQTLLPMMDQFQKAMSTYLTGPGAETRSQLAKAVAAIPGVGTDNKLVQAINRGPIGDTQEIQKLQGSMALELIKSTLNGAGKVGQGEFRILEPKFPGIDTDPKATQMIFDLTRSQAARTYQEQQALTTTPESELVHFPARWSQYLDTTGQLTPSKGPVPTPSRETARKPAPVSQEDVTAVMNKYLHQ